ncbi:ogr/Delta-like zinc finger family protein [Victivallis sp. Marseille-Q1083]|uniref:ogr/Delta-like zinc finger family protein n=1 Tax=Victivallis sp. Marseille-Q1083 TaxID=2717288 RepID=UPI00158D3B93|nr:ogr/Delta-like zinc finger family protein [Victivallis sp. Marseille-Q1083]
MRITCPHCQSRALITHSSRLSRTVAEIYCVCKSDDCAARFVMRIAFSHDVTPPASTLTNSLYEQIANLPERDKAELLRTFAPHQPKLL